MAKVKVPGPINSSQKENKNIKFNMTNDEDVRQTARKGYEVAKLLKEAGIKFKKVIPAHVDASVKKLFKLGASGPNLCLEISLDGIPQDKQLETIEEVKDQFLLMPMFTLVNDKPYQLDRYNKVHRFLFRPSNIPE